MKTISLFVIILICNTVICQSLSNLYLPLKVGNVYIYEKRVQSLGNPVTYSNVKFTIPYDTVKNGKHYYYHPFHGSFVRFDSTNLNFYQYSENSNCSYLFKEGIIDSFNVQLDSFAYSCGMSYPRKCGQKGFINFFNRYLESISFNMNHAPMYQSSQYVKGIGLVSYDNGASLYLAVTYTLKACKVDNVNLGDSSLFYLLGVSQISSEIPDKFLLEQNYPNPFNPSTKINYEIRSSGFVSLKVFDLLGKEVASLVNEKQNAGSYAVDFNSSEFNLSSGIYFYTLNAGEFKETKKMVLVK